MQVLFPIVGGRGLVVGSVDDESTWRLVDLSDTEAQGLVWTEVCAEVEWQPRRVVGMNKSFDFAVRCSVDSVPTKSVKSRIERWIKIGAVRVVEPLLPELHPAHFAVRKFLSQQIHMAKVMERVTDTGPEGIRQLVRILHETQPLLLADLEAAAGASEQVDAVAAVPVSRKRVRGQSREERVKAELDSARQTLLSSAKALTEAQELRDHLFRVVRTFKVSVTIDASMAELVRGVEVKLETAEQKLTAARERYDSANVLCEDLEEELREWTQARVDATGPAAEAMRIMMLCVTCPDPQRRVRAIFNGDPNGEYKRLLRLFHPDKTTALPADIQKHTTKALEIVIAAKKCMAK